MNIDENLWHKFANDGDGQFATACALLALTRAIDRLGNGDANSSMGAIEAASRYIGDAISGSKA